MHWLDKLLRKTVTKGAEFLSKAPKKISAPLQEITEVFLSEQSRSQGFEVFIKYAPIKLQPESCLPAEKGGSIGVVIQGPIRDNRELNRVIESVRIYRTFAPDSPVVVSSWRNSVTSSSCIPGADLILSEDPGESYPSNLTRQQVSTHAGLMRLRDLDVDFAVKTRSDQRLLNPFTFHYLKSIMANDAQTRRVWASSYGTGLYRVYGFTDQLQAGRLATLLDFWSPLQPVRSEMRRTDSYSFESLASHVQEIVLNTRWLEMNGWPVKWTWEDHLESAGSFFGILDSDFMRHVHMGRQVNALNHVTFWKSPTQNAIEEHLEPSIYYLLTGGFLRLDPPIELLKAALKSPAS